MTILREKVDILSLPITADEETRNTLYVYVDGDGRNCEHVAAYACKKV